MSAIEKRNQYAAQILAGFAANPAIFAHNDQCGWCLVNCTDGQIAAYAVRLANELFAATEAIDLNGTAEGKIDITRDEDDERVIKFAHKPRTVTHIPDSSGLTLPQLEAGKQALYSCSEDPSFDDVRRVIAAVAQSNPTK